LAELFGRKKPVASVESGRAGTAARRTTADGGRSQPPPRAVDPLPRLNRASDDAGRDPEEIIPRRLKESAAGRNAPTAETTPPVSAAPPSPPDSSSASNASFPLALPAARGGSNGNGHEIAVKATPMAPQEELALKVSDGLKNLTTLLSSIDEKMVAQHRATELVAERLQALPRVLEGLVEAEKQNIDTLRDLRSSMEKQGEASLAATEKLGALPTLVDGIGSRIEKQTEASASVKTSVEAVGQSVRGLVDGAQRTQNSLITEFRRGQDEQRQRLEELVERQRKTITVVAVIGAFVVIALFVVLARLTW
jgi:hypothetical protein